MSIERPDLSSLPEEVQRYIEYLESQLAQPAGKSAPTPDEEASVSNETPTSQQIITISQSGAAKRSGRHLYARQRRGGMGVFDLDTPESDPPTHLLVADESDSLILITSAGRGFRVPVEQIHESPVNGRGVSILERLGLLSGEELATVLVDRAGAYVALLTERGYVRWIVGHLLGEKLKPGVNLVDAAKYGRPVAACWAPNHGDLLVCSRAGLGIRFSARQLPLQGCALGIRLNPDDTAVGVAAVNDESQVLLVTADGKGTIRQMANFRANKSLGAGGKTAIKTDQLVGVRSVEPDNDVTIISRLGKIIRFQANEIPEKSGPVQGVNCMALRGGRVCGDGRFQRHRGPRRVIHSS